MSSSTAETRSDAGERGSHGSFLLALYCHLVVYGAAIRAGLRHAIGARLRYLWELPGLVRLHRRRGKIAEREFRQLLSVAGVPPKPRLGLLFRQPRLYFMKRRARRETVDQVRDMANHGRSFPTLFTISEPDDVVDHGVQPETSTLMMGQPVGSTDAVPTYQSVQGTHATQLRAGKKATERGEDAAGTIFRRPERKKGTGKTINVSRYEARLADALVDAIVKPPRGSEVQKVDTTVRGYWESNPNASELVQKAVQMSLVAAQIRTIIEHLISASPVIQGPKEIVDRVRKWFEIEMEFQTEFERGLDRFITDLAQQLLYYGTGALVRQRTLSEEVKPYRHPIAGTLTAPVWGYAIPDMATMEVFLDDYGRPRRWRQNPSLYAGRDVEEKEYPAKDVFLVRMPTQNRSMYFWTPSFVTPSLYSLNVLRGVHEILERHTEALVDIPYYISVGDKDFITGQVTQNMITDTQVAVQTTPRGATMILPWYAKINRVEAENYLDGILKSADYWTLDVRRGIGGSTLTDGQGDSSTRNTSDALEGRDMKSAAALVPEIQRAFRWLVWEKVIEWGASGEIKWKLEDVKSAKDMPCLIFEEIDMAEQIRRETHALALWMGGAIKHKEIRERIGEDPDGTHDDLYFFDVQAEIAGEQAETDLEGEKELVKMKATYQNQHGSGVRPKKRSNA